MKTQSVTLFNSIKYDAKPAPSTAQNELALQTWLGCDAKSGLKQYLISAGAFKEEQLSSVDYLFICQINVTR